jgi:hypothetical protein
LNLNNKPYNINRNELIFLNSVNASISDSGYLKLDVDAESLNNKHNRLKLKKWILTTIKE